MFGFLSMFANYTQILVRVNTKIILLLFRPYIIIIVTLTQNKDMKMKCICKKCGWSWTARVDKPACCPACKQYNYDKPKKKEGGSGS